MRTLIGRLHPESGSGEGDVQARRRAEHSVADAYDPVSWNLQTIMYARREEPDSYTGPGVPVIWDRVRAEASDAKANYDRHWRKVLSGEPEVGRFISGILHECSQVQEEVDRHGWTSQAVAARIEHLLSMVTSFQDEMSA